MDSKLHEIQAALKLESYGPTCYASVSPQVLKLTGNHHRPLKPPSLIPGRRISEPVLRRATESQLPDRWGSPN